MERPEYWAVIKDVAALPDVDDILSFSLKQDGRVLFAKNRGFPRPIMYMDAEIELWPFFDVFGRTKRIKLVTPLRLNTLSQDSSSSSREASLEPPARPPPPRILSDIPPLNTNSMFDDQPINRFFSTPNNLETMARPNQIPYSLLENLNPLRTPEIQQRESNTVTSVFNLQSSNSSFPTNDRSLPSNSNTASEDRSSANDSQSSATLARLNNAENTLLRTLATLYVSPTSSGSAPQLPSAVIPPRSFETASRTTASASPAISDLSSLPSSQTKTISESSRHITPQSEDGDCSICFIARSNVAVYRCGHVCMCRPCALNVMNSGHGCPMCRQRIEDIVQLYFS